MDDKITLTISIGELFAIRSAMEAWRDKLSAYEKRDLTSSQSRDVKKFHAETQSVLKAVAEARSRYLGPSNSTVPCDRRSECNWPACPSDCDGRPGNPSKWPSA